MRWWQDILPLAEGEAEAGKALRIAYQGQERDVIPKTSGAAGVRRRAAGAPPLVANFLSAPFLRLSAEDQPEHHQEYGRPRDLAGRAQATRMRSSRTARPEASLEDFLINRFGDRLYRTFFKSYTEKVWGVPVQRNLRGMGGPAHQGSVGRQGCRARSQGPFRSSADTAQRGTETSLIERFLYPKLGPGQMWEEVARRIAERGGDVFLNHRVVGIERTDLHITAVQVRDETTRAVRTVPCDHFISTIPVSDLITMLEPGDPQLLRIADGAPVSGFHDGRVAAAKNDLAAQSARRSPPKRTAARQLDLHSGARRPNRAPSDLQ